MCFLGRGGSSTVPLLSYGDGQLINLRGFILGCPAGT